MTHTHKANGNTFLLIEVPEGSCDHAIIGNDANPFVDYFIFKPLSIGDRKLPPGNYSIMGMAGSLNGVQCEPIVNRVYGREIPDKVIAYQDYQNNSNYFQRLDYSLTSLLASLNLNPSTTLILKVLSVTGKPENI